jgi:hypothetical protein
MWGQGLRDENKFVNLVTEWLKKDLGKQDVVPHLLAHSGAILYPKAGEQSQDYRRFPGEVPRDYPSIHYQVTQQAQTKVLPSDVDLVLVDGCINVVGVTNIINPTKNKQEIIEATQSACDAGMQDILSTVARTFPRAKVIVTGYYPIISTESSDTNLLNLWTTMGVIASPVLHSIPIIGPILSGPPAGLVLVPQYRKTATELSRIFFTESSKSLQLAIQKLNTLPPPLGGNRFRYASPKFEPLNSYGAGVSWLWLTPHPLTEKDEVFTSRHQACIDAALQISTIAIPNCPVASMGHPNISGAKEYANEIIKAISGFLPEWRAAFGLSGPAPEPVKDYKDDSTVVCPPGLDCSRK